MAFVGHMNFFRLDECGLYKVRDPNSHGCETEETFGLIKEWVKDRPLSATIPWDPEHARTGKPKCYCKDIYEDPDTGDFVMVLWKSEADDAGGIWGAEEEQATGEGDVVEYTNDYKGKKVIWGRPCYYWVIPTLSTVVSIKFENSNCDSILFQDYVSACINNRVSHPNKIKEHTDSGFVRISYGDSSDPYRYSYRFNMKLRSLSTANAEIEKLAASVTHIIRRETIRVNVKDDREKWLKIFDKLPFIATKPKATSRKIELRAEATPTAQEIRQIIEDYAKEGRKPSEWDNVGFASENTVTWADRYRMHDSVFWNATTLGVLKARQLMEMLNRQRNKYLKPIVDEQKLVNKKDVAITGT